MMSVVTRFAPSPTGELHLGSAYSAWTGWHRAREAGGTFLVLADTLARTVIAPQQLPVGVITALIGVPVFLLQLHQIHRK